VTQLVLQIVTEAFQIAGIVDETEAPSAEQGQNGLTVLNDMLANEAADGLRLGWWPQTNLTNTAPLRDQDIYGVKLMLAMVLAPRYGIDMTKDNAVMVGLAEDAKRQLTKRSLRYFESDLGELQRPQAGPWGGAGYFL
jgi:hypothetical protein